MTYTSSFSGGASLTTHPEGRMSTVMTNNKDANPAVSDAEQEMVGKTLEVHSSNITLSNRKRLWPIRCLHNEVAKFRIELVSKCRGCDPLVIRHNAADISGYIWM